MAKLTIKEIAKIAGVSPAAVSIVLNDRKGVSDETRSKIKEIVEKLQYAPNPSSRRLLFNKTNNIAVLFEKSLSPMEHLFHLELNRVILHECELLGYNLIFSSVTVDRNNVVLPNVIKSYDVDGIIFYGDIDPLILNNIKKFEIPFIVVDSHTVNPDILSVSADYATAAYTATNHLISCGQRDISYIGTNSMPQYGAQTFSGFKKAIEEHKIAIPLNWIQLDANDEDSAAGCMENILTYDHLPSAVFCAADIYAIGVIKCLRQHGIKIPDEVSIISIDDIVLARYVEPPLTTIRIDKEDMGRIAFELLIRRIEKSSVENRIVRSDNLIIRSSTKKSER